MARTLRNRSASLVGLCLMLWVMAALPAAAQKAGSDVIEGGFELREGVVVDPKRELVYVMSVERAIDAVALGDGRLAWSSKAASKPLIVADDRLVGQVEARGSSLLELAILDAASGEERAASQLELPDAVRVYIGNGPHGRFLTSGFAESAEAAIVTWEFRPMPLRGVDRGPDPAGDPAVPGVEREEELKPVSGAVGISLAEGTLQRLDAGAAVERGLRNTSRSVTNRLDADAPFVEGVSSDGRYMTRSRRVEDEKGGYYLWRVSDRRTGNEVGEVRNAFAAFAPFFVQKGIIYYEAPEREVARERGLEREPLRLQAVDLESGEAVWAWPIRDTSQTDPLPP